MHDQFKLSGKWLVGGVGSIEQIHTFLLWKLCNTLCVLFYIELFFLKSNGIINVKRTGKEKIFCYFNGKYLGCVSFRFAQIFFFSEWRKISWLDYWFLCELCGMEIRNILHRAIYYIALNREWYKKKLNLTGKDLRMRISRLIEIYRYNQFSICSVN
jgi:hypothetical protein